ncbi:diacylglycerol kinase [Xenorhabdus nematophila]|uniref:Diacylglycerol kinase n=1 Tax=Xenorhabdus nematophila (strain ATCC 19061 / DSM 3370 / CCUG 14189 / LMG 1036 / NCIMB 9965 / AN6) TaxID=406817 RepID=D3VBX5_XENNA|nr:diacylglycerol kinase [Xenorhabdus nematophila]CEE90683.1 diacylglycerol kinase [Xenorhabdus nematophila str. Anatoliense]CEF32628.1 diacylglycerol kinase [Xenorhabdus nematophila str. Websteri]AYA42210.1 diacylglycerol kinase [Xenorhabdus nematophila]MBA0020936.1 diacylglycerol kinase [Xenorhabdus nematophila]MCB4425669.1 diacylglycerol kinase [Xenorhabdus nematophila]
MANQSTGLTRIIKAAGYSAKGIKAAWQNEAAFRQEVIVAILGIMIAFSLDLGICQRILLIGSVMLVVIVEILNSAIEAVVDRIGSEYHELSGRAKDMGSAAVLLTLLLALFIWGVILWSHFMR